MVSVGDARCGDAVVSFRRTRDGERPHVWTRYLYQIHARFGS
jgi:hypothetical protein